MMWGCGIEVIGIVCKFLCVVLDVECVILCVVGLSGEKG